MLRAQKLRLERRLAKADTPAAVTREARRIGYVKPGERLFIVKGIRAGAASTSRRALDLVRTIGATTASSSSASSARRRARSRRVACAARSARPRSPSSRRTTSSGEPFPTTYYVTCPQLVAAISQARGGRRRRALERARAAASPALAASLAARPRSSAASAPSSPRAGPAATTGLARARHRRLPNPEQLKCLHAHVAFALARPGYELGERILAEIEPLWPESCCMDGQTPSRIIGRADERRRRRARPPAVGGRPPPARTSTAADRPLIACSPRSTSSSTSCNRRVGQTFTLAELADAYDEADRVAARGARARSGCVQLGSSRTPRSTSTPAAPSTTRHEAAHPRRRRRRVGPWVLRSPRRSRSSSRPASRSARRSTTLRRRPGTQTSRAHARAAAR